MDNTDVPVEEFEINLDDQSTEGGQEKLQDEMGFNRVTAFIYYWALFLYVVYLSWREGKQWSREVQHGVTNVLIETKIQMADQQTQETSRIIDVL